MMNKTVVWAMAALAAALGWVCNGQQRAEAFCGTYVSGAEASLLNNATQVALMRHGDHTVLSMQNNYRGPAQDFAMVIPVPLVLQAENVHTLPAGVFDRLDRHTAPRLVSYREEDPCLPNRDLYGSADVEEDSSGFEEPGDPDPVEVEAQFKVGEYEVVILSATESNALQQWLTEQDYNIPQGAQALFDDYINQGMFFFVARVVSGEVEFDDEGNALLSPLRFDYHSPDFSLPVRLGMVNADGPQDLVVYIMAQERHEVANRSNAFIPTNLTVTHDTAQEFGDFYEALFARTLAQNPGAVVTEYAWILQGCDPCPGGTFFDPQDFLTLGGDVVTGLELWNTTITRLHARYTAEDLNTDLVFRAAHSVIGGVGTPTVAGELSTEVRANVTNLFQGRYATLSFWDGPTQCSDPVWGRWGGGGSRSTAQSPNSRRQPLASSPTAEDPRRWLTDDQRPAPIAPPNQDTSPQGPTTPLSPSPQPNMDHSTTGGGCAVAPLQPSQLGAAALLMLGLLALRRRKR